METVISRDVVGRAWPTPVVVAGHVDHGKSTLIALGLQRVQQEGPLEVEAALGPPPWWSRVTSITANRP